MFALLILCLNNVIVTIKENIRQRRFGKFMSGGECGQLLKLTKLNGLGKQNLANESMIAFSGHGSFLVMFYLHA